MTRRDQDSPLAAGPVGTGAEPERTAAPAGTDGGRPAAAAGGSGTEPAAAAGGSGTEPTRTAAPARGSGSEHTGTAGPASGSRTEPTGTVAAEGSVPDTSAAAADRSTPDTGAATSDRDGAGGEVVLVRRNRFSAAAATSDRDGVGGEVVLVRRNRFSDAALLVAAVLLVALPASVAVAIAATVLRAGSNAGGVAVGLVVPLALLAFSAGVVRPLVTGRRVTLVLGSEALVVHDRSLFRGAEAIPRHAVAAAWIGPAVERWLVDRDPGTEVALAPDDEPVDLLLVFDELVLFDHARRKASRPKGEHRSALPQPDRPVGHLWVPLADRDGARTALDRWLPAPACSAPLGTRPPI